MRVPGIAPGLRRWQRRILLLDQTREWTWRDSSSQVRTRYPRALHSRIRPRLTTRPHVTTVRSSDTFCKSVLGAPDSNRYLMSPRHRCWHYNSSHWRGRICTSGTVIPSPDVSLLHHSPDWVGRNRTVRPWIQTTNVTVTSRPMSPRGYARGGACSVPVSDWSARAHHERISPYT